MMTLSQLSTRFSSQLVYGDPIRTEDHTTVVPVSRVRAGSTSPVGTFVVRDGAATWVAAIDVNRVAQIGAATGFVAATLACLAVLRRPPWPAPSCGS
jgi:uncharacterized spore protein YtfJ